MRRVEGEEVGKHRCGRLGCGVNVRGVEGGRRGLEEWDECHGWGRDKVGRGWQGWRGGRVEGWDEK